MKPSALFFGLLLAALLGGFSPTVSCQANTSAAWQESSLHLTDRNATELRTLLNPQQTYRQWVGLEQMSVWLLQAVVVAEDRRFYQHHGVDGKAVLRALWQNIKAGKVISGASTITQQVVHIRHPQKKNIWGKVKEAFAAWQWERRHSKEEILEQYLNWVELGNMTQGMQAAAQYYFSIPAKEVSLAQAALLAGLIQAPSRLNPLQNPQGALNKRNRLLKDMWQTGVISAAEYEMALAEPLGLAVGKRPFHAPHFVRRIALQIPEGLVESTLEQEIQSYAEKALKNHLSLLQEHHVTNGAVVVLDNDSGEVLAYVGSADFFDEKHHGQVDGIAALRQPGSALKPFIYALAMQRGLTAASLLQDEDTFFAGGFRPRNYDRKFHGKVSVRKALGNSYNVPVIKVAETLGAEAMLAFLREMGFVSLRKSAEFYGLGLALGGGEVSLLELANAYATLARGGVFKPVVFARRPLLQTQARVQRVLPESISYIITDMLADNTARADAFGLNSALNMPFAAAAKTGTSKDYKDNFAIGYTPRITVAVWVGNFDGSSMQKVSGISGAAPVLRDVLSYVQAHYPAGEFKRPYEVVSARICQQSGLLAGADCLHQKEELFVQGTQPQAFCNGQHARQNSPLSFVFPAENDVFMYDPSLPPQGQEIRLQLSKESPSCQWHINGEVLQEQGGAVWFGLRKGKFTVKATCGTETAQTHFTVL